MPLPFVVLAGGGETGAGKNLGREVFDGYARRGASGGTSARRALVLALAGNDSPWDEPGATGVAKAVDDAQAARAVNVKSSPETGRVKLRMASRASMPPFPMAADGPENRGVVFPVEAPPSPVAPLPAWPGAAAGSPIAPIPALRPLPSSVSKDAARWSETKGSAQAPLMDFPSVPAVGAGVSMRGGAKSPAPADARKKRLPGPVVAALIALAVVFGGGEWWRRNEKAKEQERARAAERLVPPRPVAAAPVATRPKEPSEAFRAWARNAQIKGVLEREGGQVRALVNGRLVTDGDWVDAGLKLRLIGLNKSERRLIFEERGEMRLEVEY